MMTPNVMIEIDRTKCEEWVGAKGTDDKWYWVGQDDVDISLQSKIDQAVGSCLRGLITTKALREKQ